MSKLATFFEISIDRLLNATFAELLTAEVADPDRFARVEAKIRKRPKSRPKS